MKFKALITFKKRLVSGELADFEKDKVYMLDDFELNGFVENKLIKVLSSDNKEPISSFVLRNEAGEQLHYQTEHKAIFPVYENKRPRGRPPKEVSK
jgi:hypothetical protein